MTPTVFIFIPRMMLLSFPVLVVEGFFFTDKKKRNGGVEDFHSFMSTYLYILPIATA